MKFSNFYKLINIFLLIIIIAFLFPILHSSVSDTSTYKNIYKKVVSNTDSQKTYNTIIDENILDIIRNGNNTVYLRHSDDDKKNRESYLDVLSVTESFDSANLGTSTKLTQKGIYQSEVLVLFFENNSITFEEVWSSPISRCLETALYFSDKVNSPDWLYLNGVSNTKEVEIKKFKDLFFKRMKNKNLMIVAHGGFPDFIGIPSRLEKSDFLVYNHDSKKVILHGSMKSIMNFYLF
tara:strand:+ start:2218 stop:2925 length:708 start_codon:yes stop_codon:yes gene_type:complete